MTTLTPDGAIDEALAGTGMTAPISRLGGAGYIKAFGLDIQNGVIAVPENVSRLSARGKLMAELSILDTSVLLESGSSLLLESGDTLLME